MDSKKVAQIQKSVSLSEEEDSLLSTGAITPTIKRKREKKKKAEDEEEMKDEDKEDEEVEVEGSEDLKKLSTDMAIVVARSVSKSNMRLWSPEDEIYILKGIIGYLKKTGKYPRENPLDFYNYIQTILPDKSFSVAQLMDKIRRLKERYFNRVFKLQNKKDVSFSKPCEKECYVLSEKIWQKEVKDDNNGRKKVKIYDAEKEEEEKGFKDFYDKYPCLKKSFKSDLTHLSDYHVMNTLSKVGDSKAKELEDMWIKLRNRETEISLKKLIFFGELYKLICIANSSSD